MKNERNGTEKQQESGENETQNESSNTTPTIINRKEAIAQGLTKYYNGRLCAHGHRTQRWTSNHSCCQCVAEKQAKKVRTEEHREKKRKWDKNRYNWQQHMQLWKNSKNRAAARGIPFNIEPEDVVIPEYCPVLGLKLGIGSRGFAHNSPSIDRVDPEKGYVKGNIHIISMRANKLKSDATVDEIRAVLKYMEEHCK